MGGCFNGKIERPRLANRALDRGALLSLMGGTIPAELTETIVGSWDFSRDIETEIIRDTSPNRLDGITINLPARAMTGQNWDGTEMNWRHAPHQYGAIHFHDDDMIDARWETDFSFTVPAHLRSGCYAAMLETEGAQFQVAFFVRPSKGRPTADIVYLASSATYTVYCNNIGRIRSVMTEAVQGRLTVIDAIDIMLLEHPELGYLHLRPPSRRQRHLLFLAPAAGDQHPSDGAVLELLRRSVHRRLAGAVGAFLRRDHRR